MNEVKNKHTIEKVRKPMDWFLKKKNKIYKHLINSEDKERR